MPLSCFSSTLSERFFQPLFSALSSPSVSAFSRRCTSLPDDSWLQAGVFRSLHLFSSGRDFLQAIDALLPGAVPSRSLFFASLQSDRRCQLLRTSNNELCRSLRLLVADPLSAFSELAHWHVFAGDGHYHGAAAHDPRDSEGRKSPTGHFFGLCLRSHGLFHLNVADQFQRQHEHDVRALKRLHTSALRRDAAKGEHILWVWDRALIDFRFWHQLKSRAIYFLSRDKANTNLLPLGERSFDRADPLNAGVLADEYVGSSNGVQLRRIRFLDPLTGQNFVFLTNVFNVRPGVLAQLYRMRWDIEKVFDELKTKLREGKAWATTPTAKTIQAQFLCLTHNLLLLLEQYLAKEHQVSNVAEVKRKLARLQKAGQDLAKLPLTPEGVRREVPAVVLLTQRFTQRPQKFIRWLRTFFTSNLPWGPLVASLKALFATL